MDRNLNNMYIAILRNIMNNEDAYKAHIDADAVLCDLLDDLGYHELVIMFKNLPKLYE